MAYKLDIWAAHIELVYHSTVTNTSLRLHADDTTEYASDVSPMVLQFLINFDLSVLSRWLKLIFLQINVSKTQAIAIPS